MPARRALVAASALLLASACAGAGLSIEAPRADLAGRQRYRWADGSLEGDLPLERVTVDRAVRAAVERALGARGYTHDPDDPDFVIEYAASVHPETSRFELREFSEPGLLSAPAGRREIVVEYEEGMLVLAFVDARTHEQIWRGVAKREIEPELSEAERLERLDAAVRALLERVAPRERTD